MSAPPLRKMGALQVRTALSLILGKCVLFMGWLGCCHMLVIQTCHSGFGLHGLKLNYLEGKFVLLCGNLDQAVPELTHCLLFEL